MPLTDAPSRPVRRRSQAERRDESGRLLVEATLKVVAEQGVSAATFDEIGRAAGYSRGLATQRFGSKRGLTEAVIAYLHQRREAVLEADHVDRLSSFAAVRHYIDTHLRDLERGDEGGRAYFMLLAASVADASSMRELFEASHDRVRVWLRALLQRGQSKGEIRRDVDADLAALMIGSLMLGLSIQRLVDPRTDVQKIGAVAIETLRRALLADPSPRGEGHERSV